jgi:hypothetical protein
MARGNNIRRFTEVERTVRMGKLPVWAQNYIAELEREVASKKDHIADISNVHPETNVRINGWISNPDITLPADSQIEFTMGDIDSASWRTKISVGHKRTDKGRNVLRIQGDDGLIIRATASNSFEVELDNR